MTTTLDFAFDTVTLSDLMTMPDAEMDGLSFGVVGLDREGLVEVYNATESRMAGIRPERVLGAPFFDAIAQCMNNFMVAQRFEDVPELDEVVPFVLTLRMRPTPVRLRLLASDTVPRRFVLIQR